MAIDDLAWAKDEPACISVTPSASEAEVLDALGVDVSSRYEATFHEALGRWSDEALPVQVWTTKHGTLIVEPNGYLASDEKVLLAIARGGDATSVFWNVNANMMVSVVERGALIRTLDPLLGDSSGEPLAEEADLPFGVEDESLLSALEFLRRRTGVTASKALILEARRPTYTVSVELPWNARRGGPKLRWPSSG